MAAVLNYPAVSISDILSRFEEEVAKTSSRDALVKLFCSQIIPFISNHPTLEPLRSRWIAKQQALAYDVDKSEQDTLEEIQNAFAKISNESSSCTFELQLNDNELWILATPNNNQVERLYLQKFHDGEHPNGSSTLRFVKKLFQKPQGGKIEVELLYKSESIAKYINCLYLPKDLKKLFFHTSHGARVQFNGIKVTAENNPLVNVELILKELRENPTRSMA